MPSTEYVTFPNTKYSDTISEFHPPPQPVILPVINEGYIDGNRTLSLKSFDVDAITKRDISLAEEIKKVIKVSSNSNQEYRY